MQSRALAYNRQWREFVGSSLDVGRNIRCEQERSDVTFWADDFRLPPPADYMSDNHESTQELL